MLLIRLLAGLLALACIMPGLLAGQDNPAPTGLPDPPEAPSPTIAFQSGGGYLLNFFQAPEGSPQRNVASGTGRIRVGYPLFGPGTEVTGVLGGDLYDGFDPSLYASLLSRWTRGIHRLEADASVRTRSPRSEVGDTVGFADVIIAGASYKLRPWSSLQVEALAEFDRQAYNRTRERNNHSFRMGGSLRFLGLGYAFSPEVGASTGVRDVKADEEDYDETTYWVTIRSVPSPPMYLSLRYRARSRSYTLDQADSRNFMREDDRQDLTLTAEIDLGTHWSWTAYLSFLHADSTKRSRVFDTQYLWTGLTYSFR